MASVTSDLRLPSHTHDIISTTKRTRQDFLLQRLNDRSSYDTSRRRRCSSSYSCYYSGLRFCSALAVTTCVVSRVINLLRQPENSLFSTADFS